MAHDVIMPKIGMYMEDIRLVEWLVDEGAMIAAGELLFTLETDKVTSDVEAETAGFLHRTVAADSMVPIGGVVGAIAASSRSTRRSSPADWTKPRPTAGAPPRGRASRRLSRSCSSTTSARPDESPGAVPATPPAPWEEAPAAGTGTLKISPRARVLIAEAGLAREVVEAIPASGAGGRLTDKDVRAHLERTASAAPAATVAPPPTVAPSPLVNVAVSRFARSAAGGA